MTDTSDDPFDAFVRGYHEVVLSGFRERRDHIQREVYENHIPEAVGGLLARQCTLSLELSQAPAMWNGHIAPLILRSQVDAHITISWVLEDLAERTLKYIHYGLGQEKLFIEYLEASQRDEGADDNDPDLEMLIKARKSWLNAQLADWATDVNVGSWSGKSVREMARETGRESDYRFAYVPFSGPVHNMWQHVGIYNVRWCRNPMHKFHRTADVFEAPLSADYMYRSSKYLSQTFLRFDDKLEFDSNHQLPIDFFVEHGPTDYSTDEPVEEFSEPSER